jgi:TP901 family phage tail tape measure protein
MADFGNIGEAFVNVRANFGTFQKDLGQAQKNLGRSLQTIGGGFTDVGSKLTLGLTLPIIAAAGAAVKFGSDFESGFAGVRKTVDATTAEFLVLEKGFKDLAKSTGTSVTEILGVGEAAGQLGIETKNILGFTETMVQLGLTTNLSSQEAATALARLANITQLPQDQFDRLGSTIVQLGNNLATTEAEIVQFGLRIAGTGKQVGLSEADILAFGAALSSVGVNAAAGGTAISTAFRKIAIAVEENGEVLNRFAEIAGTTAEEFAQKFGTDAAGATVDFIEGLGNLGEESEGVFKVLEDLGLQEKRLSDALLRSAGAGDTLRTALKLANEEFEANGALTKEAGIRLATFERQMDQLGEAVKLVFIDIFAELRPIILENVLPALKGLLTVVGGVVTAFGKLPGPVKTAVIGFLAFLAALGPILIIAGSLISAVGTIVVAFGGVGVAAGAAGAGALTFSAIGAALIPVLLTIGTALIAIAAVGVGLFAIGELTEALILFTQIADQEERMAQEANDNVLQAFNRLKRAATGPEFKQFSDDLDRIFATFRETGDVEIFRAEIDRVGRGMADTSRAMATTVEREKELIETTTELTDVQKEAAKTTEELKAEAEALAKAQMAANEATQNALEPFRNLNESFKLAKAGGTSALEFVVAYREQIKAAGLSAEEGARLFDLLGIEVGELSPELAEAVAKLKEAETTIKNVNISTLALRDGIADLGLSAGRTLAPALSAASIQSRLAAERAQELQDAWDKLAKKSKDAEKEIEDLEQEIADYILIGATAEEITDEFGDRIAAAAREGKVFGVELGKNTREFLKFQKEAKRSADFADDFREQWNTAIGNVVGAFIQSIADMDFSFKGFFSSLVDTVKSLGKTLISTFVGSLFKPLINLGQRFASNLSETILGALTGGGGPAGGLFGGLDFAKSFGGIGKSVGGALKSAIPFLTNPITIAVAGIVGVLGFVAGLFSDTPLEAGVKEITRDFGVRVREDTLTGFTEGLGLTEEQFKPIRKDILSSPRAFRDLLLPAAQASGQVDELVASFGNLEAFGMTFDLSAEALAASQGNFEALNARFAEIFGESAALRNQFGEGLDDLLVLTDEERAALDAEAMPPTGELLGDIFVDRLDQLIVIMGEGFANLVEKLTEIVDRLVVLIEGPASIDGVAADPIQGGVFNINIQALDAESFRDFLAGDGGDILINELFLRRQEQMLEVVNTGQKGTTE